VIGAREGALMDLIEGIAATLDTLADEHKSGSAQNVGERIARSVFTARAFVRTIRENESLARHARTPAGIGRRRPTSRTWWACSKTRPSVSVWATRSKARSRGKCPRASPS
jgi:hypothetical protein